MRQRYTKIVLRGGSTFAYRLLSEEPSRCSAGEVATWARRIAGTFRVIPAMSGCNTFHMNIEGNFKELSFKMSYEGIQSAFRKTTGSFIFDTKITWERNWQLTSLQFRNKERVELDFCIFIAWCLRVIKYKKNCVSSLL